MKWKENMRLVQEIEHFIKDSYRWNQTDIYPCVVNKTNITASIEELYLNKGFKYNIQYKPIQWIKNMALEAKSALNYLPLHQQDWGIKVSIGLGQACRYQICKPSKYWEMPTDHHHLISFA